jgi:hypothetical protein
VQHVFYYTRLEDFYDNNVSPPYLRFVVYEKVGLKMPHYQGIIELIVGPAPAAYKSKQRDCFDTLAAPPQSIRWLVYLVSDPTISGPLLSRPAAPFTLHI